MKINLIVAMSKNKCIGYNNKLPWTCSEDLKHFAKTTIHKQNNAVVMGSATFKSISCKPLRNRSNFILTKTPFKFSGVKNAKFCNNSTNIIEHCKFKKYDELWIIGGNQIYSHFVQNHIIDNYVITIFNHECNQCDTYATFLKDMNLKITKTEHIKNGKILYCNNI
jgi:dihydrofolate reductase